MLPKYSRSTVYRSEAIAKVFCGESSDALVYHGIPFGKFSPNPPRCSVKAIAATGFFADSPSVCANKFRAAAFRDILTHGHIGM
jgi:hypothetical protein